MTSINNVAVLAGTVVELDSKVDFEDGTSLVLNASRPTKAEAIAVGWAYYESAADDAALDAYLEEFGPVLVRRGLRAFANYAARTNQPKVATLARQLRDDITITRGGSEEDETAESA